MRSVSTERQQNDQILVFTVLLIDWLRRSIFVLQCKMNRKISVENLFIEAPNILAIKQMPWKVKLPKFYSPNCICIRLPLCTSISIHNLNYQYFHFSIFTFHNDATASQIVSIKKINAHLHTLKELNTRLNWIKLLSKDSFYFFHIIGIFLCRWMISMNNKQKTLIDSDTNESG